MTISEKQFIANIEQKEQDTINKVCALLGEYGDNLHNQLAIYVAYLCNISTGTMFSDTHDMHIAQVRWLFWLAYRYLTNDTYKSMSEKTHKVFNGKEFTQAAIRNGVVKMQDMVEHEPLWAKRWAIIKHIIKNISTYKNDLQSKNQTIEITISNTFGADICVNGVLIKSKQL